MEADDEYLKDVASGVLLFATLAGCELIDVSPPDGSGQDGAIVNGSFEENGQFSKRGWKPRCGDGVESDNTPPSGGDWSLRIRPGIFSGNRPFQVVPEVQDGDIWRAQVWARSNADSLGAMYWLELPPDYRFHPPCTSYSYEPDVVARIDSGGWTKYIVIDTLHLAPGDTAAVALDGGSIPTDPHSRT